MVTAIQQYASSLESSPDHRLREQFAELRERVQAGDDATAESVVVPSFALTYEAIRRALGMTYFDVQLLAGLVLASGAIAEMQTGEGKTIVAALPATLHSLLGQGVHIATVNSYLAERDYEQLRPALSLLGLSVGLIKENASPQQKKAAYDCDITYATGYQLGFDYLYDQIVLQKRRSRQLGQSFRNRLRNVQSAGPPLLQRDHALVIIDEIDSVLIDEATTPLILSGPPSTATAPGVFQLALDSAEQLVERRDYMADAVLGRIELTDQGRARITSEQSALSQRGLARPWAIYIENALRAKHFVRRDIDYVVQDEKVLIVDRNTGRIFAERTWRDGLHQAVEVKERVPNTEEKCTIARISRQRYFRLYDKICGMTGTASGNESEFSTFYRLPVVAIPLRKPSQRTYLPARYFTDQQSKFAALSSDVAQRHRRGQPVLIGTSTIQQSLEVAAHLEAAGLPFQILNGVQDLSEADLVSTAGRPGTITIATNMAGRGTDIKVPKTSQEQGGLHVVATEHNKSTRIDRQLIGRTARQGEPGSCQFMIAADDDLIRRYDPNLQQRIQDTAVTPGESDSGFQSSIARLQRRFERREYVQRWELLKQESWLEDVLATVAKDE